MVGFQQPPSSNHPPAVARTLLPLYCFTCRFYWAVILPGAVKRVKHRFIWTTPAGNRPLRRFRCPVCDSPDPWLWTPL